MVLRMLLEGNSIRSTERLTGTHRDTIMALFVEVGQKCERFQADTIRRMHVEDVEVDEIWGFVACKEKTRLAKNYGEAHGDVYTFTGIERTTKLMLAWHVGKRTPEDTLEFSEKLYRATSGRFQLSTDGFTPYRTAIPFVFGPRLAFAQIIKNYENDPDGSRRYSPAKIISISTNVITGQPDEDRICTSHVERSNLSIRMAVRRMTRLTNAFSKKWENHEAAMALFFVYYNFCRVHMTLKTTPAVAADLTDHPWSVQELIEKINE